ncbi:MAG: OmpA family protein [Alphaproteobacteria bacterium]|nr:OmpA family protein [Alphaproteobacteria bacterium]
MKSIHKIFALVAMIVLTGCSGMNDLDTLNRAQAVGSPFTKYLAAEYRELANSIHNTGYFGISDTTHFARKGLAAVDGVIVMPEILEDWNLSDEGIIEITHARTELIVALNNRGRVLAPGLSAVAQSSFDCWATQQEKYWNTGVPCRDRFFAVMKQLNETLTPAEPPVVVVSAAPSEEFPSPISEVSKGEIVPLQQATFLVFFDWDKYSLSNSAKSVLSAVSKEIEGREDVKQIVVIGHTDTSGSKRYNKKLSLKRGNAVRKDLLSHGFSAHKIRIEGHGETDLLIKTPDNVREPENRRAQITLE